VAFLHECRGGLGVLLLLGVFDSPGDDRQIVGNEFAADPSEPFGDRGDGGGAGPEERVKHGAVGWGDEPNQVAD
jgi:hypothetical protein